MSTKESPLNLCRDADRSRPETSTTMVVSGPLLTRSALLLFAIAAGLSVANVYFAQPLLDAFSEQFAFGTASVGFVVTVDRKSVV